jgi:hypothetical protein
MFIVATAMNPSSKCLNSSNALSACSHRDNINPAGDQHDARHLGKHLILAELRRRHDAFTGPQR